MVKVAKDDEAAKKRWTRAGYAPLNPNGYKNEKLYQLKEFANVPREDGGMELWIKNSDREKFVRFHESGDHLYRVVSGKCPDRVVRSDPKSDLSSVQGGFGGRPIVGKAASFESAAQRLNNVLYSSLPADVRRARLEPVKVIPIPGRSSNFALVLDDRVPVKIRGELKSKMDVLMKEATVDLPGYPNTKLVRGLVPVNGAETECYGVLEQILGAGGRISG